MDGRRKAGRLAWLEERLSYARWRYPLATARRTHRPGQRAAAVSPRKSAARPFNLPHNPRESEFHVSVAELLDWILLPPAIFTTFPAGWGKLTKATAGRLYASGMKKGMPDILVFAPVQPPHPRRSTVIGLELKVGANSLSSAQRTTFASLQAAGVRTYVCRSLEEVVAALDEAGIKHRSIGEPKPSASYEVPYDQRNAT